jgi:hypothetical protein
MDPVRLKLVLAFLWLVPGLVLLAVETWTGRAIGALPIGNVHIPLSWVFLLFAGFNLLRWWASRGSGRRDEQWRAFRERRHRRTEPESEPDPNFRFDDPPQ